MSNYSALASRLVEKYRSSIGIRFLNQREVEELKESIKVALESIEAEALSSLPSKLDFLQWLPTNRTPPTYDDCYDWLRSNLKLKPNVEETGVHLSIDVDWNDDIYNSDGKLIHKRVSNVEPLSDDNLKARSSDFYTWYPNLERPFAESMRLAYETGYRAAENRILKGGV